MAGDQHQPAAGERRRGRGINGESNEEENDYFASVPRLVEVKFFWNSIAYPRLHNWPNTKQYKLQKIQEYYISVVYIT